MFRKIPELVLKQTSGGGPSRQRSESGSPVRRSGSPQKRVNDDIDPEVEVDRRGKKKQRGREALSEDNPPSANKEEHFVCPVTSSGSTCGAEMATFKGLK